MRILNVRFKNLNSLAGEWEIDLTHEEAKRRINNNTAWMAPWELYDAQPDFNRMTLCFWRPLDSFLSDGFKKMVKWEDA